MVATGFKIFFLVGVLLRGGLLVFLKQWEEGVALFSFILAAEFKEHCEIPELGLSNISLTK